MCLETTFKCSVYSINMMAGYNNGPKIFIHIFNILYVFNGIVIINMDNLKNEYDVSDTLGVHLYYLP